MSCQLLGMNLPHGIGDNYALPHAITRGAIFNSNEYLGRHSLKRPQYDVPTLLTDWGAKDKVYQTAGEQLNQNSADVYCELIRMVCEIGFSIEQRILISVDADRLLRAIKRDRGLNNRIWLRDELRRLKRASFRCELRNLHGWETGFISDIVELDGASDNPPSGYKIELNARMFEVFKEGARVQRGDIRWELHSRRDPLAKALYGFYVSHSNPDAMFESTLMKVVGRCDITDENGKTIKKGQQRSKWIKDLKAALSNLSAATQWDCNYDAETKKVSVIKH